MGAETRLIDWFIELPPAAKAAFSAFTTNRFGSVEETHSAFSHRNLPLVRNGQAQEQPPNRTRPKIYVRALNLKVNQAISSRDDHGWYVPV